MRNYEDAMPEAEYINEIDAANPGKSFHDDTRLFTSYCVMQYHSAMELQAFTAAIIIDSAIIDCCKLLDKERISVTDDDLMIDTSELNGFNVMFTSKAGRQVNGCPMGRGHTVFAAKLDLKRRTEIESPVVITFTKTVTE